MRTTIEFDSDVAAELSSRRGRDRTLREDVNQLLRQGLAHERELLTAVEGSFATPTFDSGSPLAGVDDVEATIALGEGDDHR